MTSSVSQFLVDRTTDLRSAMEVLEKTERKIVFVVDADEAIFGSLTDGDIRRWILGEGGLDAEVQLICNRNPYYVTEHHDLASVKEAMLERKIDCIPVIDAANRIVKLLFWQDVFPEAEGRLTKPRLNVPVVIMAGGKGTRLEPFTRVLPKPLIPIGDKTVIETIIDQFTPYGITDFRISVHHKALLIKSFFEELRPSYSVQFLEEPTPLGTAGALKQLSDSEHSTFIITNCDILIDTDFAALLEFHSAQGNDLTIVASMTSYRIPYGICKIKNGGALHEIVEKPE